MTDVSTAASARAARLAERQTSSTDPFFDSPDHSYVKTFAQAQKDWAVPDLSAPVRTDEILLEAYDNIVTQNTPVEAAMQAAVAKYTKLLDAIPKDKLPQG